MRDGDARDLRPGVPATDRTSLASAQPRAPEESSTRTYAPLDSRIGTTSPSRSVPTGPAVGEAASRSGTPRPTTAPVGRAKEPAIGTTAAARPSARVAHTTRARP